MEAIKMSSCRFLLVAIAIQRFSDSAIEFHCPLYRLDTPSGQVNETQHPLFLRHDAHREKAKCFSILEPVSNCMFFTSINLYLVMLNLSHVNLLEIASLSLTIMLMFYQTSVQGYFRCVSNASKSVDDVVSQRGGAKIATYHFLKMCLHILSACFAIYFSSENMNPFARKYLNPFILILVHVFLYLSQK